MSAYGLAWSKSPEQMATPRRWWEPPSKSHAIGAYYDLGVRGVLIREFDPLTDAEEFGRDLIPRIRALVAGRDGGLTPS